MWSVFAGNLPCILRVRGSAVTHIHASILMMYLWNAWTFIYAVVHWCGDVFWWFGLLSRLIGGLRSWWKLCAGCCDSSAFFACAHSRSVMRTTALYTAIFVVFLIFIFCHMRLYSLPKEVFTFESLLSISLSINAMEKIIHPRYVKCYVVFSTVSLIAMWRRLKGLLSRYYLTSSPMSLIACSSIMLKNMLKSVGAKTQPCFTPFEMGNGLDSSPFSLICPDWFSCSFITISMNLDGHPSRSRMSHSPFLLTVSKAFVRSTKVI